jgi:hypothetical protein
MTNAPPVGDARTSFRLRANRLFPYLLAALAIAAVAAAIFHKFLWRDRILLFKDIGADSLNDYYPTFIHLSDYLRAVGFPSWSFSVGMGQSIFYLAGELIWAPVVWLPREFIAHALIFQHLIKTLIAGLLFFRYLQIRGLNFCSSLLGSLLLAFSACMCMGSCWVINADEVVGFTFLLLAAEIAVSRGVWFYLPIAVALLSLVTPFHLYLAALLLIFYVPARLVQIHDWRLRAIAWPAMQIGLAALIGAGLGAAIWVGSLHCMLHTPRGSGMIPNFAFAPVPVNIFQLESLSYYVTAALRPFSNDLLGAGDKFHGWENYFEAPAAYCGLVTLLFWPQIFVRANKRERAIYLFFLALVLVPVIFPWFRYAFWLFKGGYFRTFSLFSIFVFLILSLRAFSRYVEEGRLNYALLFATLLLLLIVLYFPINLERTLIQPKIRELSAITLALLAAAIAAGQFFKQRRLAGWVVVLLSTINLIYFDGLTVNRPTLRARELKARKGYNDRTIEALRDIKSGERDFYRVNKTWGSSLATRISYNDSMTFGFHGTMAYSSFNNLDYIKFLLAVEAIPADNLATDAQWSTGLLWEPLLSTFGCEKFVVTRDATRFENADQYQPLNRYGDIYSFRNTAFVPLGVTFDSSFPEAAFSHMPKWAKHQALLHAVVLAEPAAAPTPLAQLDLDEMKKRLRDVAVLDALARLRRTALTIENFRDTQISGSVRVDRDSALVFQMAFDDGWRAKIDNKPAPVFRADIGLLAVPLSAGSHHVEMSYWPPGLYLGAIVTLLALLAFAILLWRWPRIRP